MGYYEFFENCLITTKEKFNMLLNTPRARGKQYEIEKEEIIEKILVCQKYNDISEKQAEQLLKEFSRINFYGLSEARKEMKRKKIKRKYNE